MRKHDWRELLGWNDEQLEDLRHAGYAYIRQGKYDIALSFFNALVILDPDNPYDVQTAGALHLQLGHAEEAMKYLDLALKLDADHSPTLLNFAKAMFMTGKREEGIRLAEILKDDPAPHIANDAKALLLAYS